MNTDLENQAQSAKRFWARSVCMGSGLAALRRPGMTSFYTGGPSVHSGKTAMALISMRASGEVNLLTSTIVEAGSGSLKYSRRTL